MTNGYIKTHVLVFMALQSFQRTLFACSFVTFPWQHTRVDSSDMVLFAKYILTSGRQQVTVFLLLAKITVSCAKA